MGKKRHASLPASNGSDGKDRPEGHPIIPEDRVARYVDTDLKYWQITPRKKEKQ